MAAVGCVALLILPILGLMLSLWLGGATWAPWGAAIGLVLAVALTALMLYPLARARRR
jgi:hypothetical protein